MNYVIQHLNINYVCCWNYLHAIYWFVLYCIVSVMQIENAHESAKNCWLNYSLNSNCSQHLPSTTYNIYAILCVHKIYLVHWWYPPEDWKWSTKCELYVILGTHPIHNEFISSILFYLQLYHPFLAWTKYFDYKFLENLHFPSSHLLHVMHGTILNFANYGKLHTIYSNEPKVIRIRMRLFFKMEFVQPYVFAFRTYYILFSEFSTQNYH